MMRSMPIRNSLTLRQIEVLCAVADTGSVSRAAARLHVTQPAVSYQLRQVQGLFDTVLFERRNGRMQATRVCQRLLRSYSSALEEIDRAHREVQDLIARHRPTLRVSTVCATTYHWLPEILESFRAAFPRVEVVVDSSPHRSPVEAVEHGDLDVALTTQPLRGRRLRATRLFRDEIVAVVGPDHELARRGSVAPGDFEDRTVLTFDHRRADAFAAFLDPAGVRPARTLDVGATEALVTMVRAGLGIGLAAGWVVQPEIAAGHLVPLRLGRKGLVRTWFAVTARSADRPPFVDAFVRSLSDYARRREEAPAA
jgi:LysR family transcriptional regulator for metE and metH